MLFGGLLTVGTALAGLLAVVRWGLDPWAAVALFVTVTLLADIPLAWVANRARAVTGAEAMVGDTALVESGFGNSVAGRVRWRNELWNARLRGPAVLEPGDEVTILAVHGLRLEIEAREPKA
jgi:membrane protein implicated in regulation of membrane protease activity